MYQSISEIQRNEAISLRIELSDKLMLLDREDKALYQLASLDNDYVVLSKRTDGYTVRNLTAIDSENIENLGLPELISALGVADSYFNDVEEEIALFEGEV